MQGLTIYKSSAGSGKTYTLVLSYLKIVILNPYLYRNILAVTFTNKATEEMKARIIQTLGHLADHTDSQLKEAGHAEYLALEAFVKSQNLSLSISFQAGQALRLILSDYSNFSVSTIERFFQRVIRAFARELEIPLGYDVEMKQQAIIERLVSDLLMEITPENPLTRLFQGYLDRNLDEEKSWNIESAIRKLGQEIFKEQYQHLENNQPIATETPQKALKFTEELWAIRKQFEQFMEREAQKAIEIMTDLGLEREDFKYKKSGVPNYFFKVLKQDYEPGKRALTGCENQEVWYDPKKPKAHEIESAFQRGLQDQLCLLVNHYDKYAEEYFTARQVLQTIYSFGVLSDLQKKLQEYRKENNQLIISDTSSLLDKIISGTDTPFVYERIGTKYTYYLLDEFQDTSDMQWKNLFPLVSDAISREEGQVMLVGDVKQSIYRWRNGNMYLLMKGVEDQIEHQNNQKPRVHHLDKNWRTAQEIVQFNNQFFEHAATLMEQFVGNQEEPIFGKAYERLAQTPQRSQYPGYLRIEGIESPDARRPTAWRKAAMERLLETLHELFALGFLPKDITLLVRRNSEGVELAQFLQQHELKVVSSESLLVRNHPTVQFLHALLQHLWDQEDPIAQARVSYFYHQLETATSISDLQFRDRNPNDLIEGLEALKPTLLRLAVYECTARIQRLFPSLATPNAYLQGFMDAMLEYSQEQDASLSGFLQWWEEEQHKRAISSVAEPHAVEIMTIHKAKGLEFPIVILPFADWDLTPSARGFLWIDEPERSPYDQWPYLPVEASSKLEHTYFAHEYITEKVNSYLDNLNLLYVALTRPQYRLYVFTRAAKSKSTRLTNVSHLFNQVLHQYELEGLVSAENYWESGNSENVPKTEGEEVLPERTLAPLKLAPALEEPPIRVRFSSNRYLPVGILERTAKINQGELLHEALAYVKVPEDIPQAVTRMRHKGYILPDQMLTLTRQLEFIVTYPMAADWYDTAWKVKNEAEIITMEGAVLRPDRVMIREQEAIVVDYKSGKRNDRYLRQVRHYMQALTEMGYVPVRGYVYYLGEQVVEVD